MRYFLLAIAFFASNGAFAATLKILQLNFNSENVPNDSNYFVRDHRLNALQNWVKENDPDIILLEEAWSYRKDPSVALTIARAIGYDVAYRLEMGFPKFFYEADAVLAKKSFKMSGEKDLKLPHSAAEIGNGKTWVIPFGSVSYAVGVKLTLPNGEPLYVYSTHLTGSAVTDRADQARAIDANAHARAKADGVAWSKAHVIIAGDFNSTPTDPGPSAMTGDGFEDGFGAMHPGDESCTDCELPSDSWFNPFTIGAGQFPSQTGYADSLRDDYVFAHSPTFKPVASTLVFTAPYRGVWMSDHYGNFTILGDGKDPAPANPSHDSEQAPNTETVTVTTDQFFCPQWDNCSKQISPVMVGGSRGVTIENRSDFYFEVEIQGPGVIFATNKAALNPGEQAAFTFNTSGEFTYTIHNTVESPNPYRAELSGAAQVVRTGY